MGPLGVVEIDPLADDPFGFEAARQLVQVDGLGLERAREAPDDRRGTVVASAWMGMRSFVATRAVPYRGVTLIYPARNVDADRGVGVAAASRQQAILEQAGRETAARA